ncbi:DUF2235 domain-containing protein [Magnetovibrio sp.]|uniref:DUF2235 domain-containing protein n=1 Tax=Magnetovibrio sp. TaxID=2024836 RepID=UPI002F92044B
MKNIVLMSDGTANSSTSRDKTNVWRLYRALNLHRPDQVAMYTAGVGTSEFAPLKAIGGAFGWGLKEDVVELYKFLCRSYSDGDKIYLFGFSRGAFTVRLLAGMILHCGIYTNYKNEEDLHKEARRVFSANRSKFKSGLLYRAYRSIRPAKPIQQDNVKPEIEFIGVWDTVDAYGLPIDELTYLWDKLIFPLRFCDQRLSPRVKRACHAISIDDERHTFHPVLWDESQEETLAAEGEVQANRIEQVWFTGVHSDVGGGYSMNDLSLVPLDWMMSKVEPATEDGPGLHFIQRVRDEYEALSDWHGLQHDSRAGFAAYYRYKPRSIDFLCNDPDNDVRIKKPKIHRGVLERIQDNVVPYAPTGLPASYEVVSTRGTPPTFETPQQSTARADAMNLALDVIYWRRWLYAALLVATSSLILLPFLPFVDWDKGGICIGSACALDPIFELAMTSLPDFAAPWFEVLRQNPGWLWSFIAIFIVFFILKSFSYRATQQKAMDAWAALKGKGSPPIWKATCTSNLRGAARSKLRTAVKWALAFIVLLAILAVLVFFADRSVFYARSALGFLCHNTGGTALTGPQPVTFDISDPCFATGITLKKGSTYSFQVKRTRWTDGPYQSTTPNGFESPNLAMSLWVPFRRRISEPWLKLMGRIDNAGNEEIVIGSGLNEYKARSDGELFLYVNDAVFGLGLGRNWALPYSWTYGKNDGKAILTITPVNDNQ